MVQRVKGFHKPKRLECELETLTSTYGKFIAEPLERGFGQTLGNSMRRVLLSAIEGAAATSIRIAGVYHEFSTIPGVKEDVTDLVLNVKALRIKMAVEGQKTLHLKATGPGEVRASQIVTDADVEVLNPDLYLTAAVRSVHTRARASRPLRVRSGPGCPDPRSRSPQTRHSARGTDAFHRHP